MNSPIRETSAGVELAVRVVPRARKTAAAGVRDAALVIRLAAPPVEGAANTALVEFLSEALGVPRRAVTILSGERSRHKRLVVSGVTARLVRERLFP
ncbi:MAG: DUF167 domain-containing protein [Vicinamibacterales bacterium]